MRRFRVCPGACRDPTFALVAMRKFKGALKCFKAL